MASGNEKIIETMKDKAASIGLDIDEEHIAHLTNQMDHETSKSMAVRQNPWTTAWCIFAIWCIMVFSFDNQVGSIVLGIPEFRKDFGSFFEGNYVLPANWQSAFSGGSAAAGIVSAMAAGYVSDVVGRKWAIILGLGLSYIGVTLEMVSITNPVFFAGKFVNGLSGGLLVTVCVTYVGEISPLSLRGIMTAACAMGTLGGPFISALMVNSLSTRSTRWAYRSIFVAQYGFAAMATIFIPFLPESPWWLLSKGKATEAERSLRSLGESPEMITKRIALIKLTQEEAREETSNSSYLECLRRSNLRRTIISVMPLVIQALAGVSFVQGYSTYYMQLAGFSTSESYQLLVVSIALTMLGNIMSWFVVDRVGRRRLTFWGVVALTINLCIIGGLAAAGTTASVKGAVALIVFYGFLYNLTIGATAYNIIAEVPTSRLRVKTVGIGVSLQGALYMMWGFVLPYLFNPNEADLGAKTTFIFAGFCFVSAIYLWFYQPETAGRSFEELDELFINRIPAWQFAGYRTNAQINAEEAGVK